MAYFLSKEELDRLQHAEREDLRSPIPTRIISNDSIEIRMPFQISILASATARMSANCPPQGPNNLLV